MSKKYKIDEVDLKILSTLSRNGKISNVELSKIVGISPSPCLRRVNLLQEKNIIKEYNAEVNLEHLGYNVIVFASINIEINNDEEKKIFEKSVLDIKEVLEVYLLNSDSDYLVKIIVKDFMDYKIVINNKLTRLPFVKKIRTTRIKSTLKKENFIS